MSFTARRVSIVESPDASERNLVFRSEQVAQWRDAATIVDRARTRALFIVKTARKTAKMLEARSAAARRERKAEVDREFVARAAALEEAYRLARESLTDQLEATLDRVLAAALASIGAQLPAVQRLRIVCDQLAKVAGPVPAARLQLSAADAAASRCPGMVLPWPTEIDDTLAPGCCRLAADHGEWVLDFDTLVAALGPVPAHDPRGDGACERASAPTARRQSPAANG